MVPEGMLSSEAPQRITFSRRAAHTVSSLWPGAQRPGDRGQAVSPDSMGPTLDSYGSASLSSQPSGLNLQRAGQ